MQLFLPLATFQIEIFLKEWIWEFASLSCVEWCIEKGLGTSRSFPRTVFLRSISEIKNAMSSHLAKILKVSLFGYLISRRIILDLNDLWSEEIKRYDTYFIKFINTNCSKQCLLDFVNQIHHLDLMNSAQLATTLFDY